MTRPSPVRGFGWAFVAGCLLTWLCMTLLRRFEGASGGMLDAASSGRKEGRFQGIGPPEHLGLSPLALRAQSGAGAANVSLDRLIVAVRHNEVHTCLLPCAASYIASALCACVSLASKSTVGRLVGATWGQHGSIPHAEHNVGMPELRLVHYYQKADRTA